MQQHRPVKRTGITTKRVWVALGAAALVCAAGAARADSALNNIAFTIFGTTSTSGPGGSLSGQMRGIYNRRDPSAAPSVPASPVSLNTPVIQVRNESTSGALLTGMRLAITDNSHVFDWTVLETAGRFDGGAFDGLQWTQILPELPDNNSLGGLEPTSPVLDYSFTGFGAGEYFEFQTDIDPGIVDFRPILFSSTNPAQATFRFSDGSSISRSLNSGVALASPTPEQRNFQFPLDGPSLIPEPAFMQLGALSLLGMAGLLRGRKRSAA